MNADLREERDLNGIAEANKRTVFRISRDFSRTGALYLFFHLNEARERMRIGVCSWAIKGISAHQQLGTD